MKYLIAIAATILITYKSVFPQISGKILDDKTNLPISDVTITLEGSEFSTNSDSAGLFLFNVSPTSYRLSLNHIGYMPIRDLIYFSKKDIPTLIRMKPATVTYGEITVTSTRFEQLIRDIPLSLEVVNKDYITGTASVSIPDAIQNLPGITIARDGIWGTDISIRGLGRQNIVTLVDGNRIETASNHAATLDLVDINDIDKIEIIKGGISSLYGTGAEGGVVNITTKTGTYSENFSLAGSLITGYNSVNAGGSGYLSLITSSPNWYAKISGTLRSAENTNTPIGVLLNSQYNDNNISAAIGYKPFEKQELLIKYQRFHGEDIGIPGASVFPTAATAKYLLAERDMYSAEYLFKDLFPSLSNLSIKYFFQQIKRDVELTVTPNPTTTQIITPSAVHSTNGIQFQSEWTLNEFNHLVGGIDIWQRGFKGTRETKLEAPGLIKITEDFPVPNSDYLSSGIYAQDEANLLDSKLKVSLGGRYDFIRITNDNALNPSYTITNGVINDTSHSSLSSFNSSTSQNKSWSGNIGILYSLLKDLDFTFNLAHAFRSPVQEERFQYINLGGNSNIYLGNPNLNPEQGNFMDLGVRIWKSDLSFKGNIFYNNITDLITDIPTDSTINNQKIYRKGNVGKARLYGYDLGFEYNIWRTFVTFGDVSYVRGVDLLNHTDLSQIAPLNGRLGLRFPIIMYLNAEASSTLFAKQERTGTGDVATPGYAVFDIHLSTDLIDWNLIHFRLFGGMENILNKAYREYLSTNRGFIKDEPGRNFFLKLQVNW